MKKWMQAVVFALVFAAGAFGATASAQTASEALLALKKLETRCETGIAYRDYSAALAEAKFPARLFFESAGAAGQPDVVALLHKAIEHFEFAGEAWDAKFSAPRDDKLLSGGFIYQKGALGLLIQQKYPDAPTMKKYFPIDMLLPHVWSKASIELAEAGKLAASAAPSDADKLRADNQKMRASLEMEDLRRENDELKRKLEARKARE